MKRSALHSIRWRIQVWYGLLLCAVMCAVCLMTYRMVYDEQMQRVDRELVDQEHEIFHTIQQILKPQNEEKPPRTPVPPEEVFERMSQETRNELHDYMVSISSDEPGFVYFHMTDKKGNPVLFTINVPMGAEPPPTVEGDFLEQTRTWGTYREQVKRFKHGFGFVIGRDISPELEGLRTFRTRLFLGALLVWFLSLFCGWVLAGRALRPISAISKTAERIAEGNLAERIDTHGHSELDQLARVLNTTFDRLQEAFLRQKRFTSDASHELRTPVTALLMESERMLRRERSEEEYREALKVCHSSGQRMRALIESLLQLTREEGPLQVSDTIDLADLAREVVVQLSDLAQKREVKVSTCGTSALCKGDPAALSILLRNLIANAIEHNHAGGRVWVECEMEKEACIVKVRDDGPGIAREDLPHLFERFYRVDKARSGAGGHVGLGLSIAESVALRHGGSLSVESEPGKGATFTLRAVVGE